MKQLRKIILASRSPARYQILQEAGLKIKTRFPDIDETRLPGEHVRDYSLRLALEKARKVARSSGNAVVIGVDTVIAYREKIFGKPGNKDEARLFLKTLSGKWHQVYSGTVVLDALTGKTLKRLVITRVKFARLAPEVINWYVSTEEALRAAGAYSIQSKGRALVEFVDGCFTNVIGVSLPVIMKMLKTFKAI